jgi:hypothetical protein
LEGKSRGRKSQSQEPEKGEGGKRNERIHTQKGSANRVPKSTRQACVSRVHRSPDWRRGEQIMSGWERSGRRVKDTDGDMVDPVEGLNVLESQAKEASRSPEQY